ncbi:MAG TPA: hypothetical protein VN802_06840 [Stellaceae bacterium]|nr:hypothetical protein [Stellaceae bacterium]
MFALLLGLAAGGAHAADAPQSAREQVGKPVQQAQQLLRQKKYPEALVRLKEADAVPDKSPYETYVIEETRAVAAIDSGDDEAAMKALEAVLATRVLPPPEASKRLASIVQLDYQLKDYPRTVAAAQRYYKDGGSDPAPRRLMAQAYYLSDDFTNAAKTIRDVLADDERTGKPPDETLLLTLAGSAFKSKDDDGYIDALKRLAVSHPKHEYWADLVRAVGRKPGFAPRLRLDLDRLAVAAGAFDTPDQFVEAAQLALEAGFPGDARAFLDEGNAAGILGKGPAADRQERLAEMAKHQSDADAAQLDAQAKEAEASGNGTALEKLGEAYSSYGRHDDAIAALTSSIKKGGLKNPDDARLHLGVTYLRAGRRASAKDLLGAASGGDGTKDLAQLWLIQGGVE